VWICGNLPWLMVRLRMSEKGTLTVVTQTKTVRIPCETDRTLLEVLTDNGIGEMSSPCGGNGLCGKCLVRIIEGDSGAVCEDERRLLTPDQLASGLRLACRMRVDTHTTLTIDLLNTEEDAQVVATYETQHVVDGIAPDTFAQNTYGCAIDIGTTTVVVFLVRLDIHQVLDHRSAMNSQRAYGGDVISRIQYTSEHDQGLHLLQTEIVKQLDAMIASLLRDHDIAGEALSSIVAVGNPTMIHLLVGADPAGIACAPFTPAFVEPRSMAAEELGFSYVPQARLILPGAVSAYVGSDITVGLYSSQIIEAGKVVLYLDIGTNGEIVLWDGSTLYSCSSAAGPAFEGASIRQGMGAIPGAIDRIWQSEDGSILHTTIAGRNARGICGSAIIDAMALLLAIQLVDDTGAMQGDHPDADSLLIDTPDGKALKLTDTVSFTSRDVREVQLAKAAIAAGADVLLKEAGLSSDDLDMVVIAGGFGSYIDIAHAKRIGLLPSVSTEKIVTVGNAAGKGALAVLMHHAAAEEVERLRRETRYLELSSSLEFQQRYVDHMYFSEEGA